MTFERIVPLFLLLCVHICQISRLLRLITNDSKLKFTQGYSLLLPVELLLIIISLEHLLVVSFLLNTASAFIIYFWWLQKVLHKPLSALAVVFVSFIIGSYRKYFRTLQTVVSPVAIICEWCFITDTSTITGKYYY